MGDPCQTVLSIIQIVVLCTGSVCVCMAGSGQQLFFIVCISRPVSVRISLGQQKSGIRVVFRLAFISTGICDPCPEISVFCIKCPGIELQSRLVYRFGDCVSILIVSIIIARSNASGHLLYIAADVVVCVGAYISARRLLCSQSFIIIGISAGLCLNSPAGQFSRVGIFSGLDFIFHQLHAIQIDVSLQSLNFDRQTKFVPCPFCKREGKVGPAIRPGREPIKLL